MTVHYRWHPKYGQRLKYRHRINTPSSGSLLVVEAEDDLWLGIPEWMTQAEACEGMDYGDRLVTAESLVELSNLIKTLRSEWIDKEATDNPEGDNGSRRTGPADEITDG